MPPTEESYQARGWERPHEPNMTGTALAYRPPGSILNEGTRERVSGDYDAILEILDFSRGRGGPSWRWRISSGDGAGAPGEFPVDPAAGASADSQSGTYGFLTDPHGFIRRTRLDEVV